MVKSCLNNWIHRKWEGSHFHDLIKAEVICQIKFPIYVSQMKIFCIMYKC